jgi:anti-sigma regulatory factor (Ser/Thr protein kinase)
MLTKDKILEVARKKGQIRTKDFISLFGVSRQYISMLIAQLIEEKLLIRIGSTRNAFYILPDYAKAHPHILPNKFFRRLKNSQLEEHKILAEIEEKFPRISELKEHIRNIFTFAFSEMLNNAIEHSQSKNISVEISLTGDELWFIINDTGVGVFRNVMRKRKLKSELEAIQDILKGKTTTIPKSHTGQGIFFTSKASDVFILDSFGHQMTVNNRTHDVVARRIGANKRGTRVIFRIKTNSHKHLSDVFKKYTNLKDDSDYGFDKTEIRVKLYTAGGVNISRSQARRILHGLEKFRIISFDFDKVPMIGQAFADEIYRVFHNKYPSIELQEINMNEAVKFMIERAKTDAKRSQK